MVKIYAVKCDDFVRQALLHAEQVLYEVEDRGHNCEVHDSWGTYKLQGVSQPGSLLVEPSI